MNLHYIYVSNKKLYITIYCLCYIYREIYIVANSSILTFRTCQIYITKDVFKKNQAF